MAEKLDLKDKKLLYLLLENARLPTGQIAKKIGLSKNAVLYRINRLVERGIIWKFFAIVDLHKVGIYSYDLFIKLKATEKQEKEIKEYFSKHPSVVWATSLFGKWDLFVQILAKNPKDFEIILDGIVVHLGDALDSYDAKLMVERLKIDHQLFPEVKIDYKFKPKEPDYSKLFELDALDKKILNYLNEVDGLAPYHTIGRAVGASLETTRNRIARLVKEGVIVRFFPFVVHPKIGLTRDLVVINFRHLTKEIEKEIIKQIKEIPEVHLAFKTVGKPEMYFWIVTQQSADVEKIVKELKNKFYEFIVEIEPLLTTEELTLNFFPKALEK